MEKEESERRKGRKKVRKGERERIAYSEHKYVCATVQVR